jgi:hypothetical protein
MRALANEEEMSKHKPSAVPTCQDCHFWCRVKSKDACMDVPAGINKPSYRFLKSLKICRDFHPSHEYMEKTGKC